MILNCPNCGYTSNEEVAESIAPMIPISIRTDIPYIYRDILKSYIDIRITPHTYTVHQHLLQKDHTKIVLTLIPNGRKINFDKFKSILNISDHKIIDISKLDIKSNETLDNTPDLKEMVILIDKSLYNDKSQHINELCRIVPIKFENIECIELKTVSVIKANENDTCANCYDQASINNRPLLIARKSIEVGHTFYLGQKYSSLLNGVFKTNTSKETTKDYFYMGCYGIGISRLMASVVELSYDKNGIIWPLDLAPFKIAVIVLDNCSGKSINQDYLQSQIIKPLLHRFVYKDIVISDKKDDSISSKIKDVQLIGIPHYIIVGKEYYQNNQVEYFNRRHETKILVNVDDLRDFFDKMNISPN